MDLFDVRPSQIFHKLWVTFSAMKLGLDRAASRLMEYFLVTPSTSAVEALEIEVSTHCPKVRANKPIMHSKMPPADVVITPFRL